MAGKGLVLIVSSMTPKVMEQVAERIENLLEDLACEGLPFDFNLITDVRDGTEIELHTPSRKR